MDDKKRQLIQSVKYAVAKYGLSNVSTRNIGEIAGVNDAYIYHFFSGKDDLLLQAYILENGSIFNTIKQEFDKVHNQDMDFDEKAHRIFTRTWKDMLSDPDRLRYCVFYYHSAYFKHAGNYHKKQLDELQSKLGHLFAGEEACTRTMYALCTILYDSAFSVVSGRAEATDDYTESIFNITMIILKSQINI